MQFIQPPLTRPDKLPYPHFKHAQSKTFNPRYQVPQPNTKTGKEGKCKVVPVQSNKAYMGRREIHPLFINLGIRSRSAVTARLGCFRPGANPCFPYVGGYMCPQAGLGTSEKRNISYHWRELNQRIVQLVLHYHSSEQQVKLKSCSIYIIIITRTLTACDKLFSNCIVTVPLVGGLQRRLYGRL